MTHVDKQCILCGKTESELFDQRSVHGYTVTNRHCSNCGLVFQSPRMSDDELAAFYRREYRQLYQGSEGPTPKDLAVQKRRAESLLAFTRMQVDDVSHHLDIGCSAGLLLLHFQYGYGCQAVGVEPGDTYRAYAKEQGLFVYDTLEALENNLAKVFDLISVVHVLEHLPNPVDYLSTLRERWLSSGGHLLVEVPNLYAHESFEVAHLVSYSPHTLIQTLQQAGYEVTALEQHADRARKFTPYI
jgi:SAM-dependent methyltransferase